MNSTRKNQFIFVALYEIRSKDYEITINTPLTWAKHYLQISYQYNNIPAWSFTCKPLFFLLLYIYFLNAILLYETAQIYKIKSDEL